MSSSFKGPTQTIGCPLLPVLMAHLSMTYETDSASLMVANLLSQSQIHQTTGYNGSTQNAGDGSSVLALCLMSTNLSIINSHDREHSAMSCGPFSLLHASTASGMPLVHQSGKTFRPIVQMVNLFSFSTKDHLPTAFPRGLLPSPNHF
jgi:hypothetical protein